MRWPERCPRTTSTVASATHAPVVSITMPQRNAEVWVVGAGEADGSDEPGAVGLSPEHPKRIMAAKTIRVDLTAIARVKIGLSGADRDGNPWRW
jgi:hypothetical protein